MPTATESASNSRNVVFSIAPKTALHTIVSAHVPHTTKSSGLIRKLMTYLRLVNGYVDGEAFVQRSVAVVCVGTDSALPRLLSHALDVLLLSAKNGRAF